MKRFKREENAIIIHFIFYFALTIGLVVFTFSNILPQIKDIEADKIETKEIYDNVVRIKKSGLTFSEFKKLNLSGGNNRVISEILKSMTEDFYINSLVNTTYDTYKEFLENKNKELNSDENKQIIDEKRKKIEKLLPSYSDSSIDLGGNALTDYKFVNYIESIIESFNFTTSNSIGISKLVILKDFAVSNSAGEALDSNIYYIPLKLVLKGTKSGVIDLLYFIENVGNIEIKDNNILINENYGFLSKNKIKKVLEGDKYSSDYNILEHQIIDINKISMGEYLDSSYISRGDVDFKEFISNTQGGDDFEISVDLMFYVKGQPTYKIEEFINNVFNKHKETTGLVNIALKNTELTGLERIYLTKSNDALKQLSKDVLTMKKELSKKENIESLYKRVIKLDQIIDPIFKSLKNK